ncbi:MAG: MotA/TolQ/ExbB proton channel family protein [Planctomycetaceae bacterium]|jgi:biopolymer transport protein ExbB/TolQ|nr:MotA/TolQ/ExbB proton channel family protein [Planctomycetaceae bacterium]
MKKIYTSPLLLGGLLSFVFYFAIHRGWIANQLVQRYFAGHPVEYVTTVMFFVGFAILAVKLFNVVLQRQRLTDEAVLASASFPQQENKVDVRYAHIYLDKVQEYEKNSGVSLLTQRIIKALQFIQHSGKADELDDELRCLADNAAVKADADYGLVRLILWAVPMVGFLGTVIGITAALDSLDLNMINESSKKLSAGLAVAFDTTGLAIALDVLLFFIQFLVHREEMQLLGETERLAGDELRGRFVNVKETGLFGSAETCPLSPMTFADAMRQSAVELTALRKETIQQTEALRHIIGSHSELLQLEAQLRNNLAVLSNIGNFEETVNSLAAAIHLLNTNRRVELKAV